MPCNSDHLNQTNKEKYYQETASYLIFVTERLGFTPEDEVIDTSKDYYAKIDYTNSLCEMIKNLNREQLGKIVYNGRNPTS